jgi:hypothetical protein
MSRNSLSASAREPERAWNFLFRLLCSGFFVQAIFVKAISVQAIRRLRGPPSPAAATLTRGGITLGLLKPKGVAGRTSSEDEAQHSGHRKPAQEHEPIAHVEA